MQSCFSFDVDDLLGDAVEVLTVAEVPVRDAAGHRAGGRRVAALEDLRMRAARDLGGFGFEVEVVQAVEVAGELGVLAGQISRR